MKLVDAEANRLATHLAISPQAIEEAIRRDDDIREQ
jgi:hypothetical protein